jgi:hypothetical protein
LPVIFVRIVHCFARVFRLLANLQWQRYRAFKPGAHSASRRRQASTKTSAPVMMSASPVFSLQ